MHLGQPGSIKLPMVTQVPAQVAGHPESWELQPKVWDFYITGGIITNQATAAQHAARPASMSVWPVFQHAQNEAMAVNTALIHVLQRNLTVSRWGTDV